MEDPRVYVVYQTSDGQVLWADEHDRMHIGNELIADGLTLKEAIIVVKSKKHDQEAMNHAYLQYQNYFEI